jgi:hypothetical protein
MQKVELHSTLVRLFFRGRDDEHELIARLQPLDLATKEFNVHFHNPWV